MATNLVSQIMSFLTPDVISRIASYLGLERSSAQSAVSAAVPALLAGLVGLSSKPDGAERLSRTLSEMPSSILDNFRNPAALEQKSLMDSGSSLLSSLFGGGTFSSLASAIGKYSGIGEGASKSLLGLLGPLVLGGVAKQQRQSGLDASGLASMLASQKDNIASAMPSGFANMLSNTGLIDSLGDAWRSGTAYASSAARGAAASAGAAGQRFASAAEEAAANTRRAAYATRDDTRGPPANWLPWALGLLVLAGLVWWLTSQTGQRVAVVPRTETGQPAQNVTVGGVNVGGQVMAAINGMRSALRGITDVASAQAAVPTLRQAAATLDNASGLVNQLSASGKNEIASRVSTEIPAINQDFNSVMARPEVAAVVGPEIDNLKTKLDALSRG
jgi:hypothetical protein